MASSKKQRSRERKAQKSQSHHTTDLDETRKGRHKSNRGCHGRKRKSKNDATDLSPGHHLISTNHVDTTNRNHPIDVTDNNSRGAIGNDFGRRNDFNTTQTRTSVSHTDDGPYRGRNDLRLNPNDSRYSYEYHASSQNRMGDVNPSPDARMHSQNHMAVSHAEDHLYRDRKDLRAYPNDSKYPNEHHGSSSNRIVDINSSPDARMHFHGDNRLRGDENNQKMPKTNQNDSWYSYEYHTSSSRQIPEIVEPHSQIDVEEINHQQIISKGGKVNKPSAPPFALTSGQEQFRRYKRPSIVSKVTSSFSSHSSLRKNKRNEVNNHMKKENTYSKGDGNRSGRRFETNVTVQKKTSSLNIANSSHNKTGDVPVLKTNKAYNISFAMKSNDFQDSSLARNVVRTVETVRTSENNEIRRKKSSKRIQTDNSYIDDGTQHKIEAFSTLMRDVNINENRIQRSSEPNNRNNSAEGTGRYNERGEIRAVNLEEEGGRYNEGRGAGRSNAMSSEWKYHDTSGIGLDTTDAVHTTENILLKEWMIVEHPDGRQEKREYRRETNADGDVLYIDLVNGNILKTEKADWKSGVELRKKKKGSEMIRYEWRKDIGTNDWVKFNADTNEVLKRGDWRSGSEWYRNSKGKLVERSFVYKQNSDGQWVKSDPKSGMIIDYSNCSALKGYDWKSMKHGGKTKNKRWKKQDYEYVQNNKGKWVKQDPVTKRKLAKPSRSGWKEGRDYHMDEQGRVKPVKYVWQTESSGEMRKLNKKTKKPVNTIWKRGREIIMQDDKVITNNYCWVKNGRNKWVKIDEETGKPLTENIKSNKIGSYNQSETHSKTYVTKTSKRMDNNKIIEENTKIEQSDGGVIKNTTTTIKY